MTNISYSPATLDLLEGFLAEYRHAVSPEDVLAAYSIKHPELEAEFRLQAGFSLIDPTDEPSELPDISLLREIGRGGMGVVFEGWQESLNRSVAVKLHRLTDARVERSRFLSECRTLARLHQSSIVPIYTSGRSGAWLYCVMPMLEGVTLAELVRRARGKLGERLPTLGELVTSTSTEAVELPAELNIRTGTDYIRSVIEVFIQIADAIAYAHREGVWHLDLKPSNLILDASAHCWIIDFGVALRTETDPSTNQNVERSAPGLTQCYASPEQIAGSPDARSDVWGLGASLLELLTLRRPSNEIRNSESLPTSPVRLNRDCSPDLGAICLKALKANVEDRYQSAGDLAADLRNWLSGHETSARPWSPVARLTHQIRRHRPWAIAATAVLAALVTVPLLLWKKEQARTEQIRAEGETALARELLNREADSHTQSRVWSLLEQARQRSQVPAAGRREEVRNLLLAAARERKKLHFEEFGPQMDVAFRSVFAATLSVPDLVQPALADRAQLPSNNFLEWPVAIHPDGSKLALGTAKKPLVWHRHGAKPSPDPADIKLARSRVEYSPLGNYLVELPPADKGGGLRIWDQEAQRMTQELLPANTLNSEVLAIGFDENESQLWAALGTGRVRGWKIPAWTPLDEWPLAEIVKDPTAAAFTRSANAIAFGDASGRVRCFNKEAGGERRHLLDLAKGIEAIAWAPNAQNLGVGTADGILHVFDADGLRLFRTSISADGVSHIVFTPDSRMVTAQFRNMQAQFWNVRTGSPAFICPIPVWGFSKDGRTVAAGSSHEVFFGEALFPEGIRRWTAHRAAVEHLCWAQESSRFVTVSSDFDMHVWDANRHGGSIARFSAPESMGFWAAQGAVALSPKGHRVAYASGGLEHSRACIWDVASQELLGQWELPGGFEKLAAHGTDGFTLVREQTQSVSRNVRTIVYQLEPGKPLGQGRLIRPAESTDHSRFIDHWLLPDGKSYAWAGPREPAALRRVEVFDVPSGKRLARVATPLATTGAAPNCLLNENLHEMWLFGDDDSPRVVDLRTYETRVASDAPRSVSRDGKWSAYLMRSSIHNSAYVVKSSIHHLVASVSVRLGSSADSWLEFATSDFQGPTGGSFLFSADNRFLAWGSRDGSITLIDLPSLKAQVDRFETEMKEIR